MNRILNKIKTLNICRKSKERKIFSGEHPLLLFISSVMTQELSSARKEIVNHVDQIKGFIPWAFEFTPASSEDVDEEYLRKVREADFVIWLIGSTTTNPVENEIREALSSDKRLLIYKLFSDHQRDEKTERLIQEVGNRAKWIEVPKENILIDALEASISDELIRAIREKPGLSRIAKYNELYSTSRARCIARWQAAGVSLEKSFVLFNDESIGRPPMDLVSSLSEKKILVLTGDFGSGKSLMAERILQKQIKSSIENSSRPVPVYIKAQNGFENLSEEVIKTSNELGNPRVQGALVIIDGADEAGLSASEKILSEARILVRSWPNTSVIITSRPLPAYSDIEENIKIKLLEREDIISLVSKLSGIEISSSSIQSIPEPIRDSIGRPVFTLLWAKYLAQQKDGKIKTTGELINYFIEDVLQFFEKKISNANILLETLGSKLIDNGGAYVPWREIGTIDEINLLLETRLIEKVEGKIGFPLPIFSQWFAANSLVKGNVNIEEICEDFPRLDKWRYPLIVIVSLFSHDDVSKIITPVIKMNPGIAAEILNEGIARFSLTESIPLPSAKECGARIRQVYSTWISGIGNIAQHIAPISNNGSLQSIGIITDDNSMAVAWYNGKEKKDELIEIPVGNMGNLLENPGWYRVVSGIGGSQPAWIWKWVQDCLSDELKKFVERRSFLNSGGDIYKERMWKYALDAMNLGDLHDTPIKISLLESKVLEKMKLLGDSQHTKWHELNFYIRKLNDNGDEFFMAPWPGRDIDLARGGWIWEPYSDEQILKRAKKVYAAALEEYGFLINLLFKNFKSRMLIATLLPVKMHGNILFSELPFGGRQPRLNWYLEPLPKGSKNIIDFRLDNRNDEFLDTNRLWKLNQKMRPESKDWISAFTSMSSLNIFDENPITNIVYEWLEDDLRRINWM